jgi:hypothetical protein
MVSIIKDLTIIEIPCQKWLQSISHGFHHKRLDHNRGSLLKQVATLDIFILKKYHYKGSFLKVTAFMVFINGLVIKEVFSKQ